MSSNDSKYQINISNGVKWKITHPKGYKLVVKYCRDYLNSGSSSIQLSAILFTLVRDRKLSAPSGIGNSLATVIEKDYPEFKDKIHIKEPPKTRAEKAAAIRLLKNLLEMQ